MVAVTSAMYCSRSRGVLEPKYLSSLFKAVSPSLFSTRVANSGGPFSSINCVSSSRCDVSSDMYNSMRSVPPLSVSKISGANTALLFRRMTALSWLRGPRRAWCSGVIDFLSAMLTCSGRISTRNLRQRRARYWQTSWSRKSFLTTSLELRCVNRTCEWDAKIINTKVSTSRRCLNTNSSNTTRLLILHTYNN